MGKPRILTIVILLLTAGLAWTAEPTTGFMSGSLLDHRDVPVRDAGVVAVGPQGERATSTDASGRWRLFGLAPGTYDVRFEPKDRDALELRGLRVSIDRRTVVDVRLPEEGGLPEIRPAATEPYASRGAAWYRPDRLAYVPLGRNVVSLYGLAPGVTDGGASGDANPSISGASGLENTYVVEGIDVSDPGYGTFGRYSPEYGALGPGWTHDFLEEVQLTDAGAPADVGRGNGGAVNAALRSGGNDWTFDFAAYLTPGSLGGNHETVVRSPNRANLTEIERRDLFLAASGPIAKDRVFLFGGIGRVTTEESFRLTSGNGDVPYRLLDTNGDDRILDRDLDVNGDGTVDFFADDPQLFPEGSTVVGGRVPAETTRERTRDNHAVKLTAYATRSHKLELAWFGDPGDGDTGPQEPTRYLRALADPLGLPDPGGSFTGIDWGGEVLSLRWQAVWSPVFFTEATFGRADGEFRETGPGTQLRRVFDVIDNSARGGAGLFEDTESETDRFAVRFTNVAGPIELRYGAQYDESRWADAARYSGPGYTSYLAQLAPGDSLVDVDGDGFPDETTELGLLGSGSLSDPTSYFRIPTFSGALMDELQSGDFVVTGSNLSPVRGFTESQETALYGEATWNVRPNVTVRAGLRWSEQELFGAPDYFAPFTTGPAGFLSANGTSVLRSTTHAFDGEIVPRLGAYWDVRSDGRHKVFGSYGEYLQRVPNDLAVRAFSPRIVIREEWFSDAALTLPILESLCWRDADGDGVFDTQVGCHLTGSMLEPDRNVVLDGTQLQPGSEVNGALDTAAAVVGGESTERPRTREILAGYAWQANERVALEVRLIRRELDRAIENVRFASQEQRMNLLYGNLLFPSYGGEVFAGHGSEPASALVLANPGSNVNGNVFPEPVRDYTALEAVLTLSPFLGWNVYAVYRWAELEGNYEGFYRNDGVRGDPLLGAYFDFPAASAVDSDADGSIDRYVPSGLVAGQFVEGPLPTDRQSVLSAYATRQFDFGLNVGARLQWRTGQPRTPLVTNPTPGDLGAFPGTDPTYWWLVGADVDDDGNFDGFGVYTASDPAIDPATGPLQDLDLDGTADRVTSVASPPRLYAVTPVSRGAGGRTDDILELDLHASYDLRMRGGRSVVSLSLDVFNVLDQSEALRFDDGLETRTGVSNRDFGTAVVYQRPRSVRLGARYTW